MPEWISQVKIICFSTTYVPQEGPEENSFAKAVINICEERIFKSSLI